MSITVNRSGLGRFVQADTVVPGGVQGMDRHAYGNNDPVNNIDPSGHASCSDDGYCGDLGSTAYQTHIYKNAITEVYKWNLVGKWALDELKSIYKTCYDIQTYVDKLTGGKGLGWMNQYLGGTKFVHIRGNMNYSFPGILVGVNTIYLVKGGFDKHIIAHEVGHTWDINSGNTFGLGGGVGDDLIWAVGGNPQFSLRFLRFRSGDPAIPLYARWKAYVNNGYGNGSINDYAAEAFAWSVYDPNNLPFGVDGIVHAGVNQTIKLQTYNLP